MAIQTGNTVGFYFLTITATTSLPATGKEETMIYFDAKNQQICVGDNVIANFSSGGSGAVPTWTVG